MRIPYLQFGEQRSPISHDLFSRQTLAFEQCIRLFVTIGYDLSRTFQPIDKSRTKCDNQSGRLPEMVRGAFETPIDLLQSFGLRTCRETSVMSIAVITSMGSKQISNRKRNRMHQPPESHGHRRGIIQGAEWIHVRQKGMIGQSISNMFRKTGAD